ncbi:MAG: divalent-cation tolerance protein CutA [Candidatus Nitrospinota bacterium M3_3B_026]
MSQTGKLVVFITTSSEDEAKSIATILVNERLAACVNIVPVVRSIYIWEGKVQDDRETLLIAKTSEERFAALKKRATDIHSYTTPEIIALPIEAGSGKYLEWIGEVVGGAEDRP